MTAGKKNHGLLMRQVNEAAENSGKSQLTRHKEDEKHLNILKYISSFPCPDHHGFQGRQLAASEKLTHKEMNENCTLEQWAFRSTLSRIRRAKYSS